MTGNTEAYRLSKKKGFETNHFVITFKTFKNGRGGPTISEPRQSHDLIEDFDSQSNRIFEKVTQLYQNGRSPEDISRQLGISKTSIRQRLERGGVTLRKVQEVKGYANPPYGFVYVAGKLVAQPVEQERIKIIIRLAGRGLKAWRVKVELLRLGIPTRTGGNWCHKTIQKIVDRYATYY